MITAEEAKNISLKCRFLHIDELIKDAANRGMRSISLRNDFCLKEDEKKSLINSGYKLTNGHLSKGGAFDIISW